MKSIVSETRLKPCPFCGGPADLRKVFTSVKKGHITDEFEVKCDACKARIGEFESDIWIDNLGQVHVVANGAKEAFEAWNRRV